MSTAITTKAKQTAVAKAQQLGLPAEQALREWTNFYNLVANSPQLRGINSSQLLSAFLQGLSLEISFNPAAQHVVLVPYRDRKANTVTVQLQLMYQGLIYLVQKADSDIVDVQAHVVYDCDMFSYELGLEPKLIHKPKLPRPENAKPVAVYAVITWKSGYKKFDVLQISEVEKIRKLAKTQAVWNEWFEEMAKKTAIRRIIKTLPKVSIQVSKALEFDNESIDLQQTATQTDLDDLVSFENKQSKQTTEKQTIEIKQNKDDK